MFGVTSNGIYMLTLLVVIFGLCVYLCAGHVPAEDPYHCPILCCSPWQETLWYTMALIIFTFCRCGYGTDIGENI